MKMFRNQSGKIGKEISIDEAGLNNRKIEKEKCENGKRKKHEKEK